MSICYIQIISHVRSSEFNIHGLSEIIVYYADGCDSDFIFNFDVELKDGSWKDMHQAFEDHYIITDNLDTEFFYPECDADRNRGYTLY